MGKLVPPVVEAGSMGGRQQPEIEIDSEVMLRAFAVPGDVAAVVAAFSDPDIQRYHHRHLEDHEATEWITKVNDGWARESQATWAIVDRMDGEFLGRVTIYTDLVRGIGEVAYWVLPAGRGRGVATRACVAATAWAHDFGLHRVRLEHSTTNNGSRRVAEASGFVREGIMRQAVMHLDGWHDMVQYAKLATDQ